ncbi:MAG TPA: anti-sigma F factor [Clostridiales bacterium UBA9856]|jgi:stage II sporulation protein AB (anti-sigma F factor)|nr:anti-sigma F factor [Clostridiales bacterium UBA9856]HOA43179.1 anti-sigma F factor [Bacillota bacterium]HPZ59982.1 anti-sigma F factor [Bacillota bacterium]
MERTNRIKVEMLSRSENEAIARNIAAVFITPLDPTMEEMTEIKTAVSEAVSNVMLHAYKGDQEGPIYLEMETTESGKVTITVEDRGVGIDDVQKAMEPLFTTGDSRERSGMGFTVMESFMDKVLVDSSPGKGTKVTLIKSLDRVYGF